MIRLKMNLVIDLCHRNFFGEEVFLLEQGLDEIGKRREAKTRIIEIFIGASSSINKALDGGIYPG